MRASKKVVILWALAAGTIAAAQPTLYWTDRTGEKIWRSDLDGNGAVAVVNDAERPFGIALDLANRRMYWSTLDGSVKRSELDGSDEVTLYSLVQNAADLAFDSEAGYLYEPGLPPGNSMRKREADGTYISFFWSDETAATVDRRDGTVYYSSAFSVIRTDREQTSFTGLANAADNFVGALTVDIERGVLYFVGFRMDRIRSFDLIDGALPDTFYNGGNEIIGLAVDEETGDVFFSDNDGIHRVSADGQNVSTIFGPADGFVSPGHIEIFPDVDLAQRFDGFPPGTPVDGGPGLLLLMLAAALGGTAYAWARLGGHTRRNAKFH